MQPENKCTACKDQKITNAFIQPVCNTGGAIGPYLLVLTVPLYLLFLCTHCSSVPTVPLCSLFLCTHCSSMLTVPLYPLFLCAHCSSVLAVPLCSLFLCTHCSSVPTVLLCPLFLCVYSSFYSLSPSIKLQILLLCFHTFHTKVVGTKVVGRSA